MKKWYASKTFWFNVLALFVAVASQFGYEGVLPEEWQVFAPVLVVLINLVLRLVYTKEPIERSLR